MRQNGDKTFANLFNKQFRPTNFKVTLKHGTKKNHCFAAQKTTELHGTKTFFAEQKCLEK